MEHLIYALALVILIIVVLCGLTFLWCSFYIVKPGRRILMWRLQNKNPGAPKLLVFEAGVHFLNCFEFTLCDSTPFKGIIGDHTCPTPGSLLMLFPRPATIKFQSEDGISGYVEINLTVEVLKWMGSDMEHLSGRICNMMAIPITKWVSQGLSVMTASELLAPHRVLQTLNQEERLQELNETLEVYFIKVQRIGVDDFELNNKYLKSAALEMSKRRELVLSQLDVEIAKRNIQKKELQAEFCNKDYLAKERAKGEVAQSKWELFKKKIADLHEMGYDMFAKDKL